MNKDIFQECYCGTNDIPSIEPIAPTKYFIVKNDSSSASTDDRLKSSLASAKDKLDSNKNKK